MQGPITEEVVFRSALVPLHLIAGVAPSRIVFLTPLYFGIAHIHHFYEFKLTHPRAPWFVALVRSLVQFSYTSLFGFFATFIFLRTGSLPAAILVHSFCNFCGLPRFWGRVEAGEPLVPPANPNGDGNAPDRPGSSGVHFQVADGPLGIGWTVAYYALLVMGAIGFWQGLWPLTASDKSLASFTGHR